MKAAARFQVTVQGSPGFPYFATVRRNGVVIGEAESPVRARAIRIAVRNARINTDIMLRIARERRAVNVCSAGETCCEAWAAYYPETCIPDVGA